jgi:SAM-dependent methyltransferase
MGNDEALSYSGRENLEAMTHAKNYNDFLLKLIRDHAAGERVLDFGAGGGTFALPLSRQGWRVLCLEPDAQLRSQLSAAGLSTYADLDAVPPESFDAIYSLNVLEHVEDDRHVLRELSDRMKSGGRLLLYVPAFMLLFSPMDTKVGHFRRYRKRMLKDRLRDAGFDVTVARYVDSLGFLATLVYKLVGDGSGVVSARSIWLYDRFAFPLSKVLDKLVGRVLGKNLLIVAHKAAGS